MNKIYYRWKHINGIPHERIILDDGTEVFEPIKKVISEAEKRAAEKIAAKARDIERRNNNG